MPGERSTVELSRIGDGLKGLGDKFDAGAETLHRFAES